MRLRNLLAGMVLAVGCGCVLGCMLGGVHQSAIHANESLDERSGISVAALREPVELVQSEGLVVGKRPSFAYLGPVEWDRMGEVRYGLWLHVAPGSDKPVADIHGPSAARVVLADGPWMLAPLADPPALGTPPYQTQVTWGQAGYFQLDVALLKRLAANRILSLDLLGVDGSVVHFTTSADTRPTFAAYLESLQVTAD
jgi:hypothetical protein